MLVRPGVEAHLACQCSISNVPLDFVALRANWIYASACSSAKSANSGVERYLSPNDGMMTTISFPAFSERFATCNAAQVAAPEARERGVEGRLLGEELALSH